jgi:hypothetical protein
MIVKRVSKVNVAWAHKSPVFLLFFLHPSRENNNLGGFCPSLETPTRQFTSQLPRLGFQQRP